MKFTDWRGAIINSDREDGDSIISFKVWQPIVPARGDCLRFSPIVVYFFRKARSNALNEETCIEESATRNNNGAFLG